MKKSAAVFNSICFYKTLIKIKLKLRLAAERALIIFSKTDVFQRVLSDLKKGFHNLGTQTTGLPILIPTN